jgi:phage/plasmid-like protein (TIGR03299 family)
MATRARFTTTRVVCRNTLQMAFHSRSAGEVQVRHSTRFDPASVKDELGIARDTFHTFAARMRKLAAVKLDAEKASELVSASLLEWAPEIGVDKVRDTKGWRSMMSLFNGAGIGADVAGQTGWGLVNAGTEFVDHVMASKAASNRMYNAMFGKGNELKNILARRTEEALLV